ncbi:MAG: glycine cleavage system protein T [Syntrophobacteraceae bacterium]|jgi:glycine cleavage system T protein
MDQPKRTVLYDRHKALGAQMVEFGGWDMPLLYPSGVVEEHLSTRSGAEIFDVSHMGRFIIRGANALRFVQHVLTNNAEALDLAPAGAQYTLIASETGAAVDDAFLYRFFEGEYLLVVNAANRNKDLEHLRPYVETFGSVELIDRTNDIAMFALQGPKSRGLLEAVVDAPTASPAAILQAGNLAGGPTGLPEPYRNAVGVARIAGARVMVSRTGYTGEPLGFELFVDRANALMLWDLLLEKGARPAGLAARDTLRLESSLPLYGHEFGYDPDGKEIPCFAVPIGKLAVSFSPLKGEFIGRAALKKQFAAYSKIIVRDYSAITDLPRMFKCVAVAGRGIARAGARVFKAGKHVGYISSGTMAPGWVFEDKGLLSRQTGEHKLRAICLAYIDSDIIEDDRLSIDIRGKLVDAVVVPYHLRSDAPPYAHPIIYGHEPPSKMPEAPIPALSCPRSEEAPNGPAAILQAGIPAGAPSAPAAILQAGNSAGAPSAPPQAASISAGAPSAPAATLQAGISAGAPSGPAATLQAGIPAGAPSALLEKTVENTRWRQQECINLIPSEMTASPMVRLLSVMDPAFRYAEHKESKAFYDSEIFYYQGTDFIAEVEWLLEREFRKFLGCAEVDTRVISGQMANAAVFSAMVDYINRADRRSEPRRIRRVMNNHIGKGGHLSAQPMGALRDFVARDPHTERPAVVNFPVLAENPYKIDVSAALELIGDCRPELIIFGKSMVLHKEPVAEIRRYLDDAHINAVVMYDTAHVLGLIGPHFQQPFAEGADLVTASTHKTFFGTQRGIIASRFEEHEERYELWEAIRRRTFPGAVSNHHLGTMLGLLMAAYEMNCFKDEYQRKVIANAKAFALALRDCGFDVAGDPDISFTETHQVILNVGYARGPEVARRLEANNIICNYQATPGDEGFTAARGIRLGTAEMTRFGMGEEDFRALSLLMKEIVIDGADLVEQVKALREPFRELRFCFTGDQYADLVENLHKLI